MNNAFYIGQTELHFPCFDREVVKNFFVASHPRPYEVIFEEDMDEAVKEAIAESVGLVIDKNVFNIYAHIFESLDIPRYLVEPTEDEKTISTVISLVDFYHNIQANKGQGVCVIGGGILQDLAGFSAGIYKRGIPWIYLPTTLLGQADSCVGGKTGLNHQGKKNLICSFSSPKKVVICSTFNSSLTNYQLRCGYGEMFRLSLTGGQAPFKHFSSFIKQKKSLNNQDVFNSLIIKKTVVEKDEFELNERRAMNVGHTVGHAIEAATNSKIGHGIAVACGIGIEAILAHQLGVLQNSDLDQILQITKILVTTDEVTVLSTMNEELFLSALASDKKMINNELYFALFETIGVIKLIPIDIKRNSGLINSSVEKFLNLLG